jgi:hypothetical protein
MSKGVYKDRGLNHKSICNCCICKAIRGEHKGKGNPTYGKHWHLSEESIQKIREGNKKHKLDCQCASCRAKRGDYTFSGKHHTEETIKYLREINTGKIVTEETKEKQRKPKSKEHCKNLSLAMIGKLIGDKHPNWQGGIGSLPYPFDFNNELKELIRKRDNYTCQLCGKTKEDDDRKLAVHHIDYIKENLNPENLLTLCSGCNGKVNFNRRIWTKFFRLKLKFA